MHAVVGWAGNFQIDVLYLISNINLDLGGI